ncbi:DUF397 domain-containing protein [Streptomyces sp. NPDC048338]|uniref:DUF397 domain-containing protein n=1 Tax=Streptomyces sp. NPDC048338 TaxID=3365536 RepID=UPI0037162CC6
MSTTNLVWFKSSYSSGSGDDCVEVAVTPAIVHVRDSKDSGGPRLSLPAAVWADFVAHASAG